MAFRPRDLASRIASRRQHEKGRRQHEKGRRQQEKGRRQREDGFVRETFTLPREAARSRARDFLTRYPREAYMSSVEQWRELPDGAIEFTMRRLASAD